MQYDNFYSLQANQITTRSLTPKNEVFLDFPLFDGKGKIVIYFSHEENKFKYNVEDHMRRPHADDFVATLEYKKHESWLSQLRNYTSIIVQNVNNSIKKWGITYDKFTFDARTTFKENGSLKGYRIDYYPDKKPVEKQVKFMVTEDNKLIIQNSDKRYVVKQLESMPDEFKQKLQEVISYIEDKSNDYAYIDNLMKGNFTTLGDPEM